MFSFFYKLHQKAKDKESSGSYRKKALWAFIGGISKAGLYLSTPSL